MKVHFRTITLVAMIALLVGVLAACGTAEPTPTAPGQSTPTPPTGSGQQPTAEPTTDPGRDMEAYFGGETITFHVGFAPGGGYDVFGRILAMHMPKHIPGEPDIVVLNLPGAGGLRGLQSLVRAEADGLHIGYAHPRHINQALLYDDVEGFSLDDVKPVGVPSDTASTYTYFIHESEATSLDEFLATGETYNMGQTEPVGPGYPNNAIWQALDAPLNVIYGYGGTAEIAAGLDRGELEVGYRIPSTMHLYPEWVETGEWKPIFHNGAEPSVDPLVVEYLEMTGQANADIPHLYEAFDVDEEMQEYMDLGLEMFLSFSRTVVIPTDTPDDITTVIRDAFEATVADPEFVQAAEVAGHQVGYGAWEDLEALITHARELFADPQRLEEFLALAD